MITPSTLKILDEAFIRSIQENSDPDNVASVSPAPSAPTVPPTKRSGNTPRLLVLTIAAHAFRLIVLFDFVLDAATRTYFSKLRHKGDQEVSDQEITDILSEYANMVCGSANRKFSSTTLRTGMSTPCLLEESCRAQIQHIHPAHVSTLKVDLGTKASFQLVLCLCAADDRHFDLVLNLPEQADIVGGELELF